MNLPKPITTLIRIVAGRPRPSPSHKPAHENLPTEGKEPSDYCSVGVFSPTESYPLLDLFRKSDVRLQLECDTSGASINIDGNFHDRSTIDIYVHADDVAKARKIVDDWRTAVGGASP